MPSAARASAGPSRGWGPAPGCRPPGRAGRNCSDRAAASRPAGRSGWSPHRGSPAGSSRGRGVGGGQAELRAEQSGLLDFAADAQLIGRIEIDAHLDGLGGQVGDAAVQRQRRRDGRGRAASVSTSSPGGPLEARPQRHSNSSKPASQPMPPRSVEWTYLGWTGPTTGDRQPSACRDSRRATDPCRASAGSRTTGRRCGPRSDRRRRAGRRAGCAAQRPVVRRRQVQRIVAGGEAVEPDVALHVGQGPRLEAPVMAILLPSPLGGRWLSRCPSSPSRRPAARAPSGTG